MFRMLAAAFAVYVLLPEDVTLVANSSNTPSTITAGQTLDAANAVINDITGFCDRNEHACATGSALLANAKKAVSSGLKQTGSNPEAGEETSKALPDPITTSTPE